MSFTKADSVLSQTIARSTVSEGLKALKIRSIWQETISKYIDKHGLKISPKQIKAISFRMGVLRVSVPNNIYASEVRLNSREFILGINKKIGRRVVEKIRVKVSD